MIDSVFISKPYPRDNSLNPFGDFNLIEKEHSRLRSDTSPNPATVTVRLKSTQHSFVRVLTPDEVRDAEGVLAWVDAVRRESHF